MPRTTKPRCPTCRATFDAPSRRQRYCAPACRRLAEGKARRNRQREAAEDAAPGNQPPTTPYLGVAAEMSLEAAVAALDGTAIPDAEIEHLISLRARLQKKTFGFRSERGTDDGCTSNPALPSPLRLDRHLETGRLQRVLSGVDPRRVIRTSPADLEALYGRQHDGAYTSQFATANNPAALKSWLSGTSWWPQANDDVPSCRPFIPRRRETVYPTPDELAHARLRRDGLSCCDKHIGRLKTRRDDTGVSAPWLVWSGQDKD